MEKALAFLKALADESRLKLVGLLAERERSVGELAGAVGLREPTVSHHLAKLAAAELVEMRAEGTTHYYRLRTETLQRLGREVLSTERIAAFAAPAGEDAWRRKVLHTFLDGERLTKIPDTRKKRQVILEWLAERFEVGPDYPEPRVNEVIRRHHPDTATLRRELVGAGLLRRDSGVYWRVAPAAPAVEA
ncbi:MAG TPA: metalloregulator ArsR/SmtB family transcription factor [Longimicrobiaceae bacterium]|nr:metalloregulator ArsR/SmtB family transcription factor [Longimicrobiaceae bacterium]